MARLKLWIDDVRKPDESWYWVKSVNEAKDYINSYIHKLNFMKTHKNAKEIMEVYDEILIDLDHDAGDYVNDGGDYIKLLDWLEFLNIVDDSFYFHIHSMNPVGMQNMKNIIDHNNWNYVL